MVDRTRPTVDHHEERDDEVSKGVTEETIPYSETILITSSQHTSSTYNKAVLTVKKVPPPSQLDTVPTALNQKMVKVQKFHVLEPRQCSPLDIIIHTPLLSGDRQQIIVLQLLLPAHGTFHMETETWDLETHREDHLTNRYREGPTLLIEQCLYVRITLPRAGSSLLIVQATFRFRRAR